MQAYTQGKFPVPSHNKQKRMRKPGIEPGAQRWQR
jgi:hypothetical protein